jgi:CxxC motif-containing protein (DUF1111 family)
MARPHALFLILLSAGCVLASAGAPPRAPWLDANYFAGDERPGGATTVPDASITALGRAVLNMDPARWPQMLAGKRVFQREWSSGTTARIGAGLGPLYNATSCAECHFRDGRGGGPTELDPDVRLLARLAVDSKGSPDLVYGSQLSERAVADLRSEGSLIVTYAEAAGVMNDGTRYRLRRPTYRVQGLSRGAPDRNMVISARMPGLLSGLGLLEAISVEDIVAGADPDDRDRDGISGRASWVPDVSRRTRSVGRFGWKAAQPSVEQQIATAFRDDMGLTSWLRPQAACTASERDCMTRAHEVSIQDLEDLTRYVQLLAVPARRPLTNAALVQGRGLFIASGCAACHTPRQITGPRAAFPELSDQVIYPYTDLLLHDMGPGLADELVEHEARGPEWRTPPLWGLGLLPVIHGRLRLLHDGRARSVEEAILWHDGEGRKAQRAYAALVKSERLALVRFVESL